MQFLRGVVVLFALTVESAAQSLTKPYSNSSTAASACCFVVQETATAAFHPIISSTVFHSIVNLTSSTTLITPYPSSTVTNVEVNVYTTNATFTYAVTYAENPLALYTNYIRPSTSTVLLNGSQIVTAGVTVNSPAAFNVYSTVKVITAAAVTDSNGHVACGTVSTSANQVFTAVSRATSVFPLPPIYKTFTTIESIYSTLPSGFFSYITSTTKTVTTEFPQSTVVYYTLGSYTTTMTGPTFTNLNSNVQAYYSPETTNTPSGTVLTLPTPFIYLNPRGTNGYNDSTFLHCEQGEGTENYGYPAQELIDFMAKDSYVLSLYPGIASCLPGGPSIRPMTTCAVASPVVESAGGDLTASTIITVLPIGVTPLPQTSEKAEVTTQSPTSAAPTGPSPEPTTQAPAPTNPGSSQSQAPEPPASTQEPQPPTSAQEPTTVQSPESSEVVPAPPQTSVEQPPPTTAAIPESSGPVVEQPTSSQTIVQPPVESQVAPSQPQPSGESPASSQTIAPTPIESQVPPSQASGESTAPSELITSEPTATSLIGDIGQSTSGAPSPAVESSIAIAPIPLGSAIASIIGASPPNPSAAISNPTEALISTVVTLPASSGLSGLTTIIGGQTQVIISTVQTAKVSQIIIPASTTVPVLPGVTLVGSTTVVEGSTFVILGSASTIDVLIETATGPGSLPSGSAIASGNTTAPIQASGGDAQRAVATWTVLLGTCTAILLVAC